MWPDCYGVPFRCDVPEYLPAGAMEPTLLFYGAVVVICVLMGLLM